MEICKQCQKIKECSVPDAVVVKGKDINREMLIIGELLIQLHKDLDVTIIGSDMYYILKTRINYYKGEFNKILDREYVVK